MDIYQLNYAWIVIVGAHTEKLQRNVRNGEADSDYADEISYLYTADVAAHREGHVTTAIPAATEAVHYSQRPLAHYQSETSACKKQSHTLLTEAGNSHHGMTGLLTLLPYTFSNFPTDY